MFKYYNAVTNRSGDALPGYYVRLFDASGTAVDIFADANGTPISTDSGKDNAAKSDDNGMLRFYVKNGTYDIRYYDSDDNYKDVEVGIPMFEASGVYDDFASTTAGKGASLVALEGGSNVQAGLNARPTSAVLAANDGATKLGAGNDRTQADVNADTVSVFDYIPKAQQAAILAGTSTYDCTGDIHAARDAVKGTGKTLRFPGGRFLGSTFVWDGAGYRVETAPGVVFQQKPGLTTNGGGEYRPIWNVTGTGIAFGDVHFIGNIATDFGQSSHAIALTSAKNCSFGTITATNIRGDVVYAYGRTTSEAERCYGNTFTSISGTNVYRNRIGMSGGEIFVQNMPASGPYGYRDIHLEPNAEGSYQEPILRFGSGFLGVAECVSNNNVDKTAAFIGDYLDLDLGRVQPSVPPFNEYSTGPGTNSYALSLGACRLVNIRYMKVRNYNYSPFSLGDGWKTLEIGVLDVANSALTVAERCIIRQSGTAGAGKIRIGSLIWPDGSGKWIARVITSGKLKIEIGNIEAQCLIGTDLTGRIGNGSVDVGGSSDVVIGGSENLDIVGVTFTNAGSAIGVYASTKVRFTGCTATFGTATNTSTLVTATNSAINGASADGINFLTTDGVIRVGGVKVLGSRVAGDPGAASDPTTTQALANWLRTVITTQGIGGT